MLLHVQLGSRERRTIQTLNGKAPSERIPGLRGIKASCSRLQERKLHFAQCPIDYCPMTMAYDWNCPQHITPRFTHEEIRAGVEGLDPDLIRSCCPEEDLQH